MSDINVVILTGVVQKVDIAQSGWATVTIKSVKETQSKTDEFIIPIIIWKDKVTVSEGEYISANCYVNSRKVERKNGGGSFLSTQIMAFNFKTLLAVTQKTSANTSDQPKVVDDFSDCPF